MDEGTAGVGMRLGHMNSCMQPPTLFFSVTINLLYVTLLFQGYKVKNRLRYILIKDIALTSVDESVVLSRFVIHRYAVTVVPRNGYSLNLSRSYDKNVVGTANELFLILFLIDWARMSG